MCKNNSQLHWLLCLKHRFLKCLSRSGQEVYSRIIDTWFYKIREANKLMLPVFKQHSNVYYSRCFSVIAFKCIFKITFLCAFCTFSVLSSFPHVYLLSRSDSQCPLPLTRSISFQGRAAYSAFKSQAQGIVVQTAGINYLTLFQGPLLEDGGQIFSFCV